MRSASTLRMRVLAVTLSVVLPLLGGGAAWAAWSVTGTGTALARSAVLHPPTALAVSQTCVAGAVPVWRSASGPSTRSGSTLIVPAPTGVAQNDVLVAAVSWYTTGPIPTPTGWSKVREDGRAPITQAVFTRVATSSEPASYSWTHTSDPAVAGVNAYSGADTAAPIVNSSGQYNEKERAITAPSLTTTRGNARLLAAFGMSADATLATDEPMTTRWTQRSGSGVSYVSALIADQEWPTPGTTGTRNATTSAGNKSVGQLLALRPPAVPHVTTTWVPSSSPFADGQVYRRRAGSTAQTQSSLSAAATSATEGPLPSGTSYSVDVTATAGNWRAASVPSSFTVISC